MARHRLCALDEVQDGGKKAFKVDGTPLLVFRTGSEVHVLKNRCAHMNLPLSPGKFDGTSITCAFHGARFDVRTGQRDKPAWLLGTMIGGDCVPRYEATVEGGTVFVEL
jgi:3-phenylpropionate/trans-cinnamate dioxygenase ferredoxin subunit